MHKIIHILEHSLIETIKLLPFLFIAFLIIELIEHKLSKKTQKIISKSGKFGPLLGSLLGLIPQCGFSVLATNLYATRILSLGTLIAIYLSTSDEMLPILISQNANIKTIAVILSLKFIIALIAGFTIDFLLRNKQKEKVNYEICDHEHCGCDHESSIIKSSIIHVLKTSLYILIATIIINSIFEYGGEKILSKILLKDSLIAPFITAIIGFIPNCASSVIITELYLSGALSLAATIAGLSAGTGVALLILFKDNKNIKENFIILGTTYGIAVTSGIIIQLISYII